MKGAGTMKRGFVDLGAKDVSHLMDAAGDRCYGKIFLNLGRWHLSRTFFPVLLESFDEGGTIPCLLPPMAFGAESHMN